MRVTTANEDKEYYNLSLTDKVISVNKVVPYLPAKCKSMMAKVYLGDEENLVPFPLLGGGMNIQSIPYENEFIERLDMSSIAGYDEVMYDIKHNGMLKHSHLNVPVKLLFKPIPKKREYYTNGVLETETEKLYHILKVKIGLDYINNDIVTHIDKRTEKITIYVDDGYDYDY